MSKDKPLSSILEQDEASRYLEALTDKERRPQYIMNKLATSPKSFSKEEREVAKTICAPNAKIGNVPHSK